MSGVAVVPARMFEEVRLEHVSRNAGWGEAEGVVPPGNEDDPWRESVGQAPRHLHDLWCVLGIGD